MPLYERCKCACWAEGTIEGVYQRRSLKTRSWERATEIVRELQDGKTESLPEATNIPTIEEAGSKFTAYAERGEGAGSRPLNEPQRAVSNWVAATIDATPTNRV